MKVLFIIQFIFFTFCATAQTNDEHEFHTLHTFDTIKSQKTINGIKQKDVVNSNYFFATHYLKNDGLFLIQKKNDFWIVYDYNKEFGANYTVKKHQNINKKYVSISVAVSKSGIGINSYSHYVLFDLENHTYIVLHKSSYHADENDKLHDKCESTINFKNNFFVINRICVPINECDHCIESGRYKIKNNRLQK